MLVGKLGSDEPPVIMFCLTFFFSSKRRKQPLQFSVIRSLKFAKGTKGLHKNGDSYGRFLCAGAVYRQSFQVIT